MPFNAALTLSNKVLISPEAMLIWMSKFKYLYNTYGCKAPYFQYTGTRYHFVQMKFDLDLIPARINNYIQYNWVNFLIHSQTSTVQPLKFGNG